MLFTLRGVGALPRNTTETNGKAQRDAGDAVNGLCREAIEALPAAVYMTDAEGHLTFYNEAAAELWGCHPQIGESKFCGSWKLYRPDGTPLPHDQCPMAMALRQRQPIRGMEALAERPDGTRIPFIPYPTPLFDSSGRLTGAVNLLVDISERKRTEHDKQRLAAIVDSSVDAIVGKDLKGIVTSWNPGAERLFGYAAREMIGKSITILIPHHLHHEEAKILDRIVCGERVEHFDTTRVRKDGSLVKISLSVSPVRNAQGMVVGASKIARDISERTKIEELQKREQVLRELLGGLPAAVYVTDAAGRITYCNESAINLWGTRPKLGEDRWCDLARFYHVDGTRMEPGNCPTEIALKQGKCVRGQEAVLERTDGTRIPIIPYPTPLRDAAGTVIGVVNMTVDISVRKQAELALSERTMQLELAGRAALVGSFGYDFDSEMIQISEGYAAIHGFPEGTTEVARCQWQAGVHPDDLGEIEAVRRRTFHEGRREYGFEYRIVRPNGEVRWIESRTFVSYSRDGRPERLVGVNIDVTERKRAQEHQRTLNAELDHRVKNVMAAVSAIAARTMAASSSMNHFVDSLDGRIQSMARTHELLSATQWQGVSMRELVQRELAPYATRGNTEITGLDVILKAEAGQAFGMVLHELVINAAKYGALSSEDGCVSIRWHQRLNGNPSPNLVLDWQEVGGPSVVAHPSTGFGMTTIRDLIPYEFGGTADLTFDPAGVRCRLELSTDWLTNGSEPNSQAITH